MYGLWIDDSKRFSVRDFDLEFPDDDACFDALVALRYPHGISCPVCGRVTRHHRVRGRACYECQNCGHQEYPRKGTVFGRSTTPLRTWFRAIYAVAAEPDISAADLGRALGVGASTAGRVLSRVGSLLSTRA